MGCVPASRMSITRLARYNGVAPFVFHSFISLMSTLQSSCCPPCTVLSPADAELRDTQAGPHRVQWGHRAGVQVMITLQNELGLVIASPEISPGIMSKFSFLPCAVETGLLVGGPRTGVRFEPWWLN